MTRSPHRASLSSLGDRVWLVLGGGGLKGLGHIGAWRALLESGVRPAGILGTSIGALLAVNFSAGTRWQDLERRALQLRRTDIVRINRRVVWVNGIRQRSVFRGDSFREYLGLQVPAVEWNELEIPCQVNAVSLRTGRSVWFGQGGREDVSPLDAVHASASLPVLYPPVAIGDDYFVDGGVGDTLGLDRAAELGATGIVAIDTGAGGDEEPATTVARGLVGVHQRVFGLMSGQRRSYKLATWTTTPLLLVRPDLDGYGVFDFEHVPYFIEAGYRATMSALV